MSDTCLSYVLWWSMVIMHRLQKLNVKLLCIFYAKCLPHVFVYFKIYIDGPGKETIISIQCKN